MWDATRRARDLRPSVAVQPARGSGGRTITRRFPAFDGRDGVLWRRPVALGAYRLRIAWRGTTRCTAPLRADPGIAVRATVRADLAAGRCTLRLSSPLDRYVGLTFAEARALARRTGRTVRVVERDGESLVVTEDFSTSRVNVAVRGDRVIRVAGVF